MTEEKIQRINELARKSKTPEGLTEQEKQEQQALRQEYIRAIRGSLASQLRDIRVQEPDGSRHPLPRKSGADPKKPADA